MPTFPQETIYKMLHSEEHKFLKKALLKAPLHAFAVYDAFKCKKTGVCGARRVEDPARVHMLFEEHIGGSLTSGRGLRPSYAMTPQTPGRADFVEFRPTWEWWGRDGWRVVFFMAEGVPPTGLMMRMTQTAPVIRGDSAPCLVAVIARGGGYDGEMMMGPEHDFVAAYALGVSIPNLCYRCDKPTRGIVRCRSCADAVYCSATCRRMDRAVHRNFECGREFCCGHCRRKTRADAAHVDVHKLDFVMDFLQRNGIHLHA